MTKKSEGWNKRSHSQATFRAQCFYPTQARRPSSDFKAIDFKAMIFTKSVTLSRLNLSTGEKKIPNVHCPALLRVVQSHLAHGCFGGATSTSGLAGPWLVPCSRKVAED